MFRDEKVVKNKQTKKLESEVCDKKKKKKAEQMTISRRDISRKAGWWPVVPTRNSSEVWQLLTL